MRLIDVDKLEADVEYWENHDDPKKPDYDTRDIEQVIGFQPIVEAIPIEWFKKEIGWLSDNGVYGAEVYQWVLNRWYEDKEEWEKENEIGTNKNTE